MHTIEKQYIMNQCALMDAILSENHELEVLIREQMRDSKGLQGHGEYLGGNGQTDWNHCQAKDKSSKPDMSDELDYDSHEDRFEAYLMGYFVASHQSELETNGMYNVRQLAHWKGGFDAERFEKYQGRMQKKQASHGYKFDRRRKPEAQTKEARIAGKLAALAAKEARRAAKKRK